MLNLIPHTFIVAGILILLLLSIVCQIMIGILYQNMIKESDNMTITQNKYLKQCKLKFYNCHKLNEGVPNIPVFVEKFISGIRVSNISLRALENLSRQFLMMSVLIAGLGICKGIIDGESIIKMSPYYAISLISIYIEFSVSSMIDIAGKRKLVEVALIDFLENHMSSRLANTRHEEERLKGFMAETAPKQISSKANDYILNEPENDNTYISQETDDMPKAGAESGHAKSMTKSESEELEELLKEFFEN